MENKVIDLEKYYHTWQLEKITGIDASIFATAIRKQTIHAIRPSNYKMYLGGFNSIKVIQGKELVRYLTVYYPDKLKELGLNALTEEESKEVEMNHLKDELAYLESVLEKRLRAVQTTKDKIAKLKEQIEEFKSK